MPTTTRSGGFTAAGWMTELLLVPATPVSSSGRCVDIGAVGKEWAGSMGFHSDPNLIPGCYRGGAGRGAGQARGAGGQVSLEHPPPHFLVSATRVSGTSHAFASPLLYSMGKLRLGVVTQLTISECSGPVC